MPQEDEQTVVGIIARRRYRASPRCPNRSPERDGDIDAGMGFVDHPWPHLAAGDKPLDIERPVRWCRWAGFIAVRAARQRCPNWHGAHGCGEVGVASDGPAATGDGRGFDTEHLSQ